MSKTPVQASRFCRVLFVIISFTLCHPLHATPDSRPGDTLRWIRIGTIGITGNRQTKPWIITREVPFREGDSVAESSLSLLMKKARENIFNTRLFNFVTVDTVEVPSDPAVKDVRIHVIERWYIWPWPYFEISDRNFNAWLQTMDFSRLTYGLDVTFYNMRGRNETLVIPIHFGFNQKIGFNYKMPAVNRRQTLGLSFGAYFERNHEIIVASQDNKTVYYKDPDHFPKQDINGFTELSFRPGIYSRHTFRLSYQYCYFSDSVTKIPGYLPDSLSQTGFFSFYYQYKYDRRDVHYYPLKGFYLDGELYKDGFFGEPMNDLYIKASYRHYWQLCHRWYFATGVFGKLTLSKDQPYFLQKGLGYGKDYVRGYEYYVVDGQHFILVKNNLKFAILPERVFAIGFIRNTRFNTVPYALYANLFTDMGYVYNENKEANLNNNLQNSFLIGYGLGLDFTTYYDIVIRLEFSLNARAEPGLYLHFVAPI
ncbi:MAG TPA: POTRA domain-containing protein [Bacteroidales bacterium]|nr:POTRA domain-containing protein [Bacteroidales bacterium]